MDHTAQNTSPFRCDFCGEAVKSVRRVALDRGYDRLQRPHRERYACPRCSRQKDSERRREEAGPGAPPEAQG